mmetsp:Transcript_53660/g.168894  ORF Transcript_53660/g.168894 Transcript_53660/m.168894 type:complete len:249 (+) Transcript_53660:1057-1803(+)
MLDDVQRPAGDVLLAGRVNDAQLDRAGPVVVRVASKHHPSRLLPKLLLPLQPPRLPLLEGLGGLLVAGLGPSAHIVPRIVGLLWLRVLLVLTRHSPGGLWPALREASLPLLLLPPPPLARLVVLALALLLALAVAPGGGLAGAALLLVPALALVLLPLLLGRCLLGRLPLALDYEEQLLGLRAELHRLLVRVQLQLQSPQPPSLFGRILCLEFAQLLPEALGALGEPALGGGLSRILLRPGLGDCGGL